MDSKEQQPFEQSDFDLGGFLRSYGKYAWVFALTVPLFLSAAWVFNWYTNPVYEVSTKLMIANQETEQAAYFKELEINPSNKVFENEIEVIKSHSMVAQAISRLEFGVTYHLVGNFKTSEVYKSSPFKVVPDSLAYPSYFQLFDVLIQSPEEGLFIYNRDGEEIEKPFLFGQTFQVPAGSMTISKRLIFDDLLFAETSYEKRRFRVKFNTPDQSKNSILSRLNINLAREGSSILRISMEDEVPLKAMDFLDMLTSVYLEMDIEQKNTAATLTSEFIEDQLSVISKELNVIELDKQNYKVSEGIVDLDAESRLLMESAIDIDKEIADIGSQIKKIEYLQSYISTSNRISELAPTALDIKDPLLASLIGTLNELEGHRKELVFSTLEGSPNLAPVDAQIERTKNAILENARNIKTNVEQGLSSVLSQRDNLNRKIGSIPKRERELVNIERQFRIKENLYTYLLEKKAEVSISLASASGLSRVVDKARTNPGPLRPIPSRAYSMALLLGLLLPLLIIYLKEKLTVTVSSRKTIESLCSVPIIGTLGIYNGEDPFFIKAKPRSAISESIRAIRTNLKYFTGEGSQRVILISSSVGSEGKTFSALNLAGSIAIAGNKTILLGMDLRKPKLAHTIGLSEEFGLSSYLIGKHDLDDVIQASGAVDGLDVIAAGPVPPNPSELIMSQKMNALFDMLKTKYDHIIIDSPPIGLVTDGFLLAKYADAVIYVIKQHVTKKSHVKLLDDLHQNNKLPNLSILFNAVKVDRESSYGGYGHTYGYGYFEEEEKSPARQILNKTKELLSEN